MIPHPRPVLRRCGDRGWLFDVDTADISAWVNRLGVQPWLEDIQDVVPSDKSILVVAKSAESMDELAHHLSRLRVHATDDTVPNRTCPYTITIPIRYDGCDLAEVARRTRSSEAEVARLHSQAAYTVAFFGFAPGFAYLRGLSPCLHLPRRDTPRERVAAGSVAIAGTSTVVYPGRTPGGWHLIGTTEMQLWDIHDDLPNRLDVGDRVVFEPIK